MGHVPWARQKLGTVCKWPGGKSSRTAYSCLLWRIKQGGSGGRCTKGIGVWESIKEQSWRSEATNCNRFFFTFFPSPPFFEREEKMPPCLSSCSCRATTTRSAIFPHSRPKHPEDGHLQSIHLSHAMEQVIHEDIQSGNPHSIMSWISGKRTGRR